MQFGCITAAVISSTYFMSDKEIITNGSYKHHLGSREWLWLAIFVFTRTRLIFCLIAMAYVIVLSIVTLIRWTNNKPWSIFINWKIIWKCVCVLYVKVLSVQMNTCVALRYSGRKKENNGHKSATSDLDIKVLLYYNPDIIV